MTERAQNAGFHRKPQIFADSPLLLEIKHLEGAGNRWWVPNPASANPRVAERASWPSSQSGVTGVRSLVEIPRDCYLIAPELLTPSSDLNSQSARKALSATRGLAPGGLGTCQNRRKPQIVAEKGRKPQIGLSHL